MLPPIVQTRLTRKLDRSQEQVNQGTCLSLLSFFVFVSISHQKHTKYLVDEFNQFLSWTLPQSSFFHDLASIIIFHRHCLSHQFFMGLPQTSFFSWALPRSSFFHGICLSHHFFMGLPQSSFFHGLASVITFFMGIASVIIFSWTLPQPSSFSHGHSLNFASVIIPFLDTVMERNALANQEGRKLAQKTRSPVIAIV